MTNERRIEKLYPALTASERVVLILADRQRGEPDDPMVRTTMPRYQEPQFNGLLRDAAIANVEVGMLILALYEATRAQEWRWRWFEALVARHNDLAAFCEATGDPEAPPPLLPPIDRDAPSDETLAGRLPVLLKGLRDDVVAVAGQAQATKAKLEEFSRELGGADPLRPEARAYLEATEARAGRLIERLEDWLGPIERADCDAYLAELGRLFETARRRE